MSASARELLGRFLADHPEVPGVFAHLRGPRFAWSDAAGVRDVPTGEPLAADATYRIASITKTFVAAATLRLWEEGRVDVDDPMGAHIDDALADVLGERRCEQIRLRHLLTHTSGLADFVEDTNYHELTTADPQRRWTRLEQVELGLTVPDVGEVDGEFHYSDTGYVILGEILENTTGENLGVALRTLLGFDRLELTSTFLETMEPVPPASGMRTHQYIDGVDCYDWNPSVDLYGGGGLVSCSQDVATFFEALFEGRVYHRPETLQVMTEPVREAYGAQVGMGIAGRDVEGHRLWGHGGFWGVYSGYLPDDKVGVSVGILDRAAFEAAMTELLPAAVRAGLELAAQS